MALSTLRIYVPETMVSGDFITFSYTVNNTTETVLVHWIDPSSPTPVPSLFTIPVQSPYYILNYNAIKYREVLINYFNTSGFFQIIREGNYVIIQSTVDNLVFNSTSSSNTGVTFTIQNGVTVPPIIVNFSIDTVTFSKDDASSNHLITNVQLNADGLETRLLQPLMTSYDTENPKTFSWLRGSDINVTVEEMTSEKIDDLHVRVPGVLLLSEIIINTIFTSQTDNTTNIDTSLNDEGLSFQYSLDNINYFDSNVFLNVALGKQTVYVKDQYDLVVSKEFTVVNTNLPVPYFSIAKSNPIRYAYRERWDGESIYKTDENTLSGEARDLISYADCHLFQTNDVVTQQIKTNFSGLGVKIINLEDKSDEQIVPVVLKKKYLGEKDARDGILYRISEGKAGIYFGSGNLYDFSTLMPNGSHQLNGSKLYWLRKGTNVTIQDYSPRTAPEIFEIQREFYNDDLAAVVEINKNYTGPPKRVIVRSIYDVEPFDLYEFETDFSAYENKKIAISITATHQNDAVTFETIRLISEQIYIKRIHKDCLLLEYWNNNNGDVYYSETGIRHFIRLPYLEINDNTQTNVEVHKGDTQVTQIEATLYEGDIIKFKPLSKEITKLIQIAVLSDNLFINQQRFQAEDVSEKEKSEATNFYLLSIQLLKAEGGYNNYGNRDGLEGSVRNIPIPGLIEAGDGFIRF